jgi:hypothetical protein
MMDDITPVTPAKAMGDVFSPSEVTPDGVRRESRWIPPAPLVSNSPVEKKRFQTPEKDEERNVQRRKTAIVLDSDDHATTNRNILLSLESLLSFISNNFCCKRCHKSMQGCVETSLQLGVFGIACGLNFNCDCGVSNSLRPNIVPDATEKLKTLEDGKPYGTRVNSGDFEINRRLQLVLQLCGGGRQDGNIIAAGMLKLNVNPMRKRWTDMQEHLGKVIIAIGCEVLEENLHIECKLSPLGQDGRHALDVASDTRWDKRGSTRRYDSLSGCAVAFGLRSDLPIGIEPMSSACIKCKKGIHHEINVCPKNYEGSAKGMEAAGAAKIVKRLFANETERGYVARLVTDDDSLVRNILTRSYCELLRADRINEIDCPRYANGQKKPDNGLLPLLHPVMQFLADKGHHVRGYSRVLFVEVYKSKKEGCGCTKMDAERMKRRLSWTLRLHWYVVWPTWATRRSDALPM